jgi:predicted secreted protein
VQEPTEIEQVDVATGDPVVVVLADDGPGGYLWRVADLPAGITIRSEESLPPAEAAAGATGTKLFELEATEPGTHTVRFERRRDWEPGADREHSVVVVAR